MIYLASPFTHPDFDVRKLRHRQAAECAAGLIRGGHCVFSPIAHSYWMSKKLDLPQTFEFWKHQDFEMIRRCDRVFVLKLDGWDTSKGVQAEIEFAKKLSKSIAYIEPNQ